MSQEVIQTPSRILLDTLKKYERQIAAAAPKHMTATQMLQLTIGACNKTPKLLQCTPMSVLNAVMHLTQLGLQPRVNEAYLIPFMDKYKKLQATPVIDYRGKIKLARQSGCVRDLEPHLVYEADEFELNYSTDPKERGLHHKPKMWEKNSQGRLQVVDQGEVILGYCIGWLTDGNTHIEVMTYEQIEHVRSKSRSKDDGPWVTDWDQMALKTLVHRICKMLPWSGERGDIVVQAQELEDRVDVGMEIEPFVEMDPADDQPPVIQMPKEEHNALKATKGAAAKAEANKLMKDGLPIFDSIPLEGAMQNNQKFWVRDGEGLLKFRWTEAAGLEEIG